MNKQAAATYLLFIVSAAMFVVASEQCLRMEQQARFDYANSVYLSNVLAAILGGGMGGLCLLKLSRDAEEKINEAKGEVP